MSTHDLSTGGDVLDRVTRFAARAARAYGCAAASTVRLLNVSENATYLVEDPDQEPCILRGRRRFEREVAARPVADVHEVEQLREPALALGLDVEHRCTHSSIM